MAFKRVRNARRKFKAFVEMLSDRKRERLEKECTEKGIFEFKSQTAVVRSPSWASHVFSLLMPSRIQFGSLYPLVRRCPYSSISGHSKITCLQRLDDQFIIKRIV